MYGVRKNLWFRMAVAGCLLGFFAARPGTVGAFNLQIFPEEVTGGEGFLLAIENAAPGAEYRVKFAEREYLLYRQDKSRQAIFLPLKIEDRGTFSVEVSQVLPGGSPEVKTGSVSVVPREVRTVRISAAGIEMRQAQPSIQRQQEQVLSAIRHRDPRRYWQDDFMLPLQAGVSAEFALRRERGEYATYHRGVDFTAPQGTPVKAINCGRVVLSEKGFNIYGNLVVLDHGQGVTSCYFHLDRIFKDTGDMVSRGEIIGEVGQSGWASGPHLHLGVYLQGIAVDPLWWVNFADGE